MKSLQFLQLARRARRIELGEIPVRTAVHREKAKLLLFARDASENSKKRVKALSQNFDVPFIELDLTKAEFGALFSRESLAMAALTDKGMALAFLEKWDASSPLIPLFLSRKERRAKPE
ncbi:ribosomal L7Ae/L30e/S12e/Gadd45 family protein [Oscillospiraceae bacterium OttesenSCG-928-G22]|nr:ribosomal L7Ae/L30e/S12e/Gadd45 family protein [Oscillospiraceae bacterium OttesenSCG-928-G22]